MSVRCFIGGRDPRRMDLGNAMPAVRSMDGDDLDVWYEEAQEALRESRDAVAVEILSRYVEHRPEHAYACYCLGDALRLLGRGGEARDVLRRAEAMAPEAHAFRVQVSLGMVEKQSGAPDRAEDWFRRATGSLAGRDLGWAWIERGSNFAEAERFLEAEACNRKATTLSTEECDHGEAWLNLGYVLRAQRRYEEAVVAFREAHALAPDQARTRKAVESLRGIDDAVRRLKPSTTGGAPVHVVSRMDSLSMNEVELDARFEGAREAWREGRDAVAVETLTGYVEERPDHLQGWQLFGQVLRGVGRRNEARAVLIRAMALDPENLVSLVSLGDVETECGAHDRAEDWFRRATESPEGRDVGWVWIKRGSNLAAAERLVEAESCHHKATTLPVERCDRDEAWLNLGNVLRSQRRYDEAASAFREAHALDPDVADNQAAVESLRGMEDALRRLKAFDH